MYEILVTALKDYWAQIGCDTDYMAEELKSVLSEHYGRAIDWTETSVDQDAEVSIYSLDLEQVELLATMAIQSELDGSVREDLEASVDETFRRFAEAIDQERSFEKFVTLIGIQESDECLLLPVELDSVVMLHTEGEEEDECCGECCSEEDCCANEEGRFVMVGSVHKLRTELDELGKILGIEHKNINLDDENYDFGIKDDDSRAEGIVAWHVLSNRVNKALEEKNPLVIRYDEALFDEDSEDFEASEIE